MTPSLETPLNKELTAFLEKHGLDAALATLKRLNIASLQVLKIEMAPPRDTRLKKEFKYDKIQASWTVLEGLRAEIDSAIAESKVNYRILNEPGVKALHEFLVKNGLGNLKILEGLLNSKVESQEGLRELGTRKADWKELRDRITSAGLATAFAFDKLLQTETQKEDLKQLTDFLTSRSLNSPDIVKVFEDNGITSMNQLSHLRKDDAKWEEFKKKVAPAANEAQLADLNKIDVEHISMAVDEVKNPDPTGRTQAQKRREELKEALAAVSDLREKVGKKAGEAGAVSLDDAKKAFNSLVEKLSKNQYLDLSFTNAADAKNQDDLLKLFKVAETDVKFVDAELKKVAETPSLTLNELIERTDLKKGFCFAATLLDRRSTSPSFAATTIWFNFS